MAKKGAEANGSRWAGRIPQVKPGTYADGLPFHDVRYICGKLILRPNHFTSRHRLFDFTKVMRRPARDHGVKLCVADADDAPLRIREVLFVDTADFRLYNNAFILRRRVAYEEGFPVGEPEIVFKFRHPDLQRAAETDVRPRILGDHKVKFKCQALPLQDRLGGIRILYSHNVQFPRADVFANDDVLAMTTMQRVFPALRRFGRRDGERIKLVSDTIIEEVLQDIGRLDFGDGITGRADVGLWRTRGEHLPLIGEFSFQIRFKDRGDLSLDAMTRAEAFFVALQYAAQDWIALNATKTGVVYRLQGNAPNAYE